MRTITIVLTLVLVACSMDAPKVAMDDHADDNWKNTYPDPGDTSFYHHEAFFPNGSLLHRIDHVNGKRHGLYQEWDSTGALVKEGAYVNGRRNGAWQIFKNGRLTQFTYSDGTCEGPTFEELEDGRVVHGQYSAGKESGIWVWVQGRSIEQMATYEEGQYDGISIGYWPNGLKQIQAVYSADTIVGEVLHWDSLGRPSTAKDVGYTFMRREKADS